MFVILNRNTLEVVEELADVEKRAILSVMEGSTASQHVDPVRTILERVHSDGPWRGCDCQGEDHERPLATPVRNHRGTLHWRVFATERVPHAESCVFHRSQCRQGGEDTWSGAPRRAPTGYFQVLRNAPPAPRVSAPSDAYQAQTGQGGRHRPALSRWLLQLVQLAGLNRLRPDATTLEPRRWRGEFCLIEFSRTSVRVR